MTAGGCSIRGAIEASIYWIHWRRVQSCFIAETIKTAAGSLREETLWLLGAEGVRQWDGLEKGPQSRQSRAVLRDSGFYLLAAQKETQLVVDAGPLGTQSGGHGHADALSVCLQSEGHSLLIDPGTFEYVGPGDDRDLFRGTAMHNTVQVDGANQAEPATPFSWRRLTQSKSSSGSKARILIFWSRVMTAISVWNRR